jgi:hypothetical protein
VDKQLDLLQGTLDMLILKAVSLGPLHGYGILLRIQQISKDQLEIQQAPFTQRCTASSIRAGSRANGASLKIIARLSITGSRQQESGDCRPKLKNGTVWRTSSRESWARRESKYDALEPSSFLDARDVAALPVGERNGCGIAFPHGKLRRGPRPQRRSSPGSDAAGAFAIRAFAHLKRKPPETDASDKGHLNSESAGLSLRWYWCFR